MSPRMGRPPSADPKRNDMKIRLTDSERAKLDYAAQVLGMTKADVIRHGIDFMYHKAKETEKE